MKVNFKIGVLAVLLMIFSFALIAYADLSDDGHSYIDVDLISPATSNISSTSTINFTFYANMTNVSTIVGNFSNATFFINYSGVFVANESNSSAAALRNVTFETSTTSVSWIEVSNLLEGNYTWNINVTNGTHWNMFDSNATIVIDTTDPVIIYNMTFSNHSQKTSVDINLSLVENNNHTLLLEWNASGTASNDSYTFTYKGDTEWYVRTSSSLSNGNYSFRVLANDSAARMTTTALQWYVVDTTAPIVVLNTGNNEWSTGVNTLFKYTPIDTFNISNCSLWTNTTGSWAYNQSNVTIYNNTINNFTIGSLENNSYIWYVNCSDSAGNWGWAANNNTLIVGKAPDLIISNITWKAHGGGVEQDDRPISGTNVTINVTIINAGTSVASPNVTSTNAIGINISLFWDGTLTNQTNITSYNISNGEVFYINFTRNLIDSGPANKHNVTAVIDQSNIILETNETNNTLEETLFTGLNITILNITYNGTIYPALPKPGENVTINLSVRFPDGGQVTDFNMTTNISVYDVYKGTETYKTPWNTTNTHGYYNLTFTVPAKGSDNRAEAGIHTYKIFGYHNNSGVVNYTGWANDTTYNYSMQAPDMYLEFLELDISKPYTSTAATDTFNIQLKNNGTTNISDITITIYEDNTSFSLVNTSCTWSGTLFANNSLKTVPNCTIKYTASAAATGAPRLYSVYADARGTDAAGGGLYNISRTYSSPINATNTTTTSSSSSSTSTSSGSTAASAGTATTTHTIDFTTYPSKVEIVQGESKKITVKAKNKGNATLNDLKLSLSGVSWTDWYTVSPSSVSTLPKASTQTFKVTLNVSEERTVGVYSITLKVLSDEASDTETFSLTVLPTEETKVEINETIDELEKNITKVLSKLEGLLKSKPDNVNFTSANESLTEALTLLEEAKAAILEGDYVTAYTKEQQISNLLSEIETKITAGKEVGILAKSSLWIIIIVIVIALAIVGFVLYSSIVPGGGAPAEVAKKPLKEKILKKLRPPKTGYHPEKGYIHRAPGEKTRGEKIKEILNKIRRKKSKGEVEYKYKKDEGWSAS